MALLFQLTQKLSQGFAAAWARWPRKDKKIDAEKAWNQKVKTPETEDAIHTAFDWQIPMLLEREPRYRPLLGSWLRGEEWNNEPPPTTTPNRVTAPAKTVLPMALQQQEASQKIRLLVEAGMDREQAKTQVYKELGWVK